MIPVEAGMMLSPGSLINAPRASQSASASSTPPGAPTLATRLLISTALTRSARTRRRPIRIGAPQKRLFVKTPANAELGSSSTIQDRFMESLCPRSPDVNSREPVAIENPSGSPDRPSSSRRYCSSD